MICEAREARALVQQRYPVASTKYNPYTRCTEVWSTETGGIYLGSGSRDFGTHPDGAWIDAKERMEAGETVPPEGFL